MAHQCKKCHIIFTFEHAFHEHMRKVHDEKIPGSLAGLKVFECNICKANFTSIMNFTHHRISKHNDRRCYECKKTFHSLDNLESHFLSSVHPKKVINEKKSEIKNSCEETDKNLVDEIKETDGGIGIEPFEEEQNRVLKKINERIIELKKVSEKPKVI